MTRKPLIPISTLCLVLLVCGWSAAAPSDSFTDPENAGPEFAAQGEYSGSAGNAKIGAQVIALGNGMFQAVLYPGGLPGDGWDGKTRIRLDGKGMGGTAQFATVPSGWGGAVENGGLMGQTGEPLAVGGKFQLARVTRRSSTQGTKPPEGAHVLFDGSSADAWEGGRMTPDHLLECGSRTKETFRDFMLHLEFRTPFKPEARGQSRGNSGVYIFGRYEVQILDSFGLDGKDNECGSLYRQTAPSINICYPPLAWQTYDIDFQSPRFDDAGAKVKNAVITLRHNGVVVQEHRELTGPTGGGKRAGETAGAGPIMIQNHGNPVRLRNVWILDRS